MSPHMSETTEPQPEKREDQYTIRDLAGHIMAMVGAIVCFAIAALTRDTHRTTYELARDLGIAFFVALVVTIIYEVYARGRYERKKFVSTLQVIMNHIVHPGVWDEVRAEIIDRDMIRENCLIRLRLVNEPGLKNGQMVLCVEFAYELQSLSSRPERVTIVHYLDDHIENKEKKLPRFELIEIGNENFSDAGLNEKVKDGLFTFETTLKPSGQSDIRVRTVRREITYVPGSYNLIMGEICCGIRIILDEIPIDIGAYVHVWPHTNKPIPLGLGKTLDKYQKKIMLPGQGCEFRFQRKDS